LLRVVISARARREIFEARGWWLDHRDKAPRAFDEDLKLALELIAETPNIGELYRSRRRRIIRRVLLHRTKHHVYYRDTPIFVEVVALWHSSRRPPAL